MTDRMTTHGEFGWCELMTGEVDAAVRFYTEVIGWGSEVADIGMGPYTVLKVGDRPVAGIMARPAAPGGQVLVGPMDIPSVGRMAVIAGPGGGPVGIITYAGPGPDR